MTPAAEPATATAAEVASVARLIAAAGLAEGFGHVSARSGPDTFTITSTAPLGAATAGDTFELPVAGEPEPRGGLPLEAPMHAAIYAARPDVGAVVRGHSPSAVAVGLGAELPPVTHGLAGLSGELARSDDPQLVTDEDRGAGVVAALGAGDCVLLRGNGALATGADLASAAVRAWFLEERCRVWLESGRGPGLGPAELAQRSEHWAAEAERAWRWLRWRFGGGGEA